MTDADRARLLITQSRHGGWVLFYFGSMACDAARPVIAELEVRGLIRSAGTYKSLLLYRVPG